MALLTNAQQQVSAAPGAGNFALGAVTPGAQTWSAAGAADGVIYAYRAEEGATWEVGTGTYTASGATLSRTVVASSNGNAKVSFGAAAVVSQVALPADVQFGAITVTGADANDYSASNADVILASIAFVAPRSVLHSIGTVSLSQAGGGTFFTMWLQLIDGSGNKVIGPMLLFSMSSASVPQVAVSCILNSANLVPGKPYTLQLVSQRLSTAGPTNITRPAIGAVI